VHGVREGPLDRLDLPTKLRQALAEAIRRLVELARPDAVVLFGSWAEGRARRDSDVDLLVVARTESRHDLAARLYLLWHQLGHVMPDLPEADILVYTPQEFENNQVIGFPAYEAARLGEVLYGRLPTQRSQMAGQGGRGPGRC
jgi:predicted nucleotidyltransferase